MRRVLLTIAAMLIASCSLLASSLSTTNTLNFSGYKNPEVPESVTSTFTIKYYDDTTISGLAQRKDISSEISDTETVLSNAFMIEISSNTRNPIVIELDFSPFTNSSDSSDKVPLSYAFTKTVTKTMAANYYYNRSAARNERYTFYAYTPSLILEVDSTEVTTVQVPEEGVTATLTYNPAAVIWYVKQKNNTTPSVESLTNTQNDLPTTDTNANSRGYLPYFGSNQVMESSARFALSIDADDYANMMAFADYIATVRLTITMD